MKPWCLYKETVCLRLLFFALLLQGTDPLLAQKSGEHINAVNRKSVSPDGKKETFEADTHSFNLIFQRFKEEVDKRGELDLDSLRHFGNKAAHAARLTQYDKGLINTYLGFGSGFISKPIVDSAKFYYTLAMDLAAAIQDTGLLSRAYSGYGWALVYDDSDYKGAIDHSLVACQLANAIQDTSLWIQVTTKLVKIYYVASKFVEAFRLCTDLQQVCEIRKDTSAQIHNYYMFGSIYGRMQLFDKQREMAYKGQELNNQKNDTSFLYTVNLTKSNSFLLAKQYDSVLYYSRLNIRWCEHLNMMPNCYGNIAKAFLETDMLDSARYYYTLIMAYHDAHGTYIDTDLYLELGNLEYKSGHSKRALEYFKKAEADISRPSLPTQANIYGALFQYYDDQKNYEKALHYHKKYKIWTDSISGQALGTEALRYESSILKQQNKLLLTEKEYQTILALKQRNERNLALGGAALILFLGGAGFYRFRKQKILKGKQELLNERLRISRELHDEVGATLSGIAMYSHVAKEQLRNAKHREADHSLEFMQKAAGEMVHKLSDIVWLINPEQDTIMEMIGRLGQYGKQMTQVRDMQIKIDLPADLATVHIPLDARRNIYLFCKEAINNAVKYSQGKTLVLQVQSTGHHLIFSVGDDGKGFDESIVRQGHGLVNMEKRAQDIGAVFHVETAISKGTRVELRYKLIT